MSKGTIVLVPFPFTDLSGQKVRPALILSASKQGEDCIVAFMSSLKQKKLFSFDIVLPASTTNGLKTDSIIKINKIATLQKQTILGTLGVLEPKYMKLANAKLKDLFRL